MSSSGVNGNNDMFSFPRAAEARGKAGEGQNLLVEKRKGGGRGISSGGGKGNRKGNDDQDSGKGKGKSGKSKGKGGNVKLSKQLSYTLRHGAKKLNLAMASDGYVLVDDLISKRMFKNASLEQIKEIVEQDAKGRYNLVQDDAGRYKIRANQGHTLEIVKDEDLLHEVKDPAAEIPVCIHGTYQNSWEMIKKTGLNKMARNHIHMSVSPPTANAETKVQRGIRTDVQILIYVDTKRASDDGIIFMRSDNGVILSSGDGGVIHPRYFQKVLEWPSGKSISFSITD